VSVVEDPETVRGSILSLIGAGWVADAVDAGAMASLREREEAAELARRVPPLTCLGPSLSSEGVEEGMVLEDPRRYQAGRDRMLTYAGQDLDAANTELLYSAVGLAVPTDVFSMVPCVGPAKGAWDMFKSGWDWGEAKAGYDNAYEDAFGPHPGE
jgi:hypothetical protein